MIFGPVAPEQTAEERRRHAALGRLAGRRNRGLWLPHLGLPSPRLRPSCGLLHFHFLFLARRTCPLGSLRFLHFRLFSLLRHDQSPNKPAKTPALSRLMISPSERFRHRAAG